MTSIVNKREEYIKKINEIKEMMDIEIQKYKENLMNELQDKLAVYSAELTAKYSTEIKKYQERINLLEDIIKEEMAIPQSLVETIQSIKEEQTIEQSSNEIVVEELPAPEDSLYSITQVESPIVEENLGRPGMSDITIPTRN